MRYLTAALLLLAALLIGCQAAASRQAPAEAPASGLSVVATFSVVGDLVANVGGERVKLVTLVGPNGDVHTFEPNPADSGTLRNAALVVENGAGLEPWLDDLYAASGSRAARVVLTAGYPLLELGAADGRSDEHGHADEERDPHAWHDPAAALHMVGLIRDALTAADPANTAEYAANAERYQGELRALDAWASEELKRVPEPNRKLVTAHRSFNYFAARYGFTVVGTVLPTSTEAADPSVGELSALVETIKAAGVPTIFTENTTSPRLMQRLAEAANVKVAVLFDVLGEPNGPASSYLKLFRHNVSTVADGLAP